MKTITRWDDLGPFGVEALTGEACGLSYRVLCDVTGNGKRIIEKALGIPNLSLPENWNRGDPADPHIGCVMAAPELLVPLGVFALLENGCCEVWRTKSGSLLGLESAEDFERVEALQRHHAANDDFVQRYAYVGTAGDRNRHAMTGRTM